MSVAARIGLAVLVDVFVEIVLARRVVLVRFPSLPPLDRLAFQLFRRSWGPAAIACRFEQPAREVN